MNIFFLFRNPLLETNVGKRDEFKEKKRRAKAAYVKGGEAQLHHGCILRGYKVSRHSWHTLHSHVPLCS